MTDEDALVAAAAAEPHLDTPRLVLADWLDDHDQPTSSPSGRGR
ncbi:TIGR02996 domain-containing protein [bacterium]|nr:TIGR02996 domain-containing protein [bacterium]